MMHYFYLFAVMGLLGICFYLHGLAIWRGDTLLALKAMFLVLGLCAVLFAVLVYT